MGVLSRIAAIFRGTSLSHDHEEEMDFHVSMREEWNVEKGMERPTARRDARLRFGSVAKWREQLRHIDAWTLPESLLHDLRFGTRMLVKHPGFTLAAIAALAIGIGLNTVVFTLGKAAFARGLDAKDASRMVNVSLIGRKGEWYSSFSYPDYEVYRDEMKSFAGVIAEAPELVRLAGAGGAIGQTGSGGGKLVQALGLPIPHLSTGETEFAKINVVSENYFEVLGEQAFRGRVFSSHDRAELMASPSVLISENYWELRFKSDLTVVGRSMKLNGASFTVIGITPRDFTGTGIATPDFWMPMVSLPLLHAGAVTLHDRNEICCRIFARLADGVTMAQAQSEMQGVADRLRGLHDSHSDEAKPSSALVWPGSPFPRKIGSDIVFSSFLMMLAVGLVLVIACANVSSLQLARAAARQNELTMRRSLGASRARVIRQLFTESVLLAICAGGMALLFAWALLRFIVVEYVTIVPPEWGTPVLNINPDLKVFAYVLSVSILAGVMFGLAPALESSRSAWGSSLKANQNTSPARGGKSRNALVATQVAVCLVLMITGSLLIRSSMHALSVKYEVKRVLNLELQFPDSRRYTEERELSLAREIRAKISALPGVVDTSLGRAPDGGGVRTATVSTDPHSSAREAGHPALFYTYVAPNYFQVVGIPLQAGRSFDKGDMEPEPVAIVSQSAAKILWHGENAIGRSIWLSTAGQFHGKDESLPDGPQYEVIGVVADAGGTQLDGSDAAQIYVPLSETRMYQYPLLVRTAGNPERVTESIGGVLAATDPAVIGYTSTLEELLHESPPFVVSRCAAGFTTIVGAFGLLLACMGIYGTVSYMVVLRTHEVGIRMALGASRRNVLALMLRESMRPVVMGIGAGLVLAGGASFLLRMLLYGMSALDVLSFAGMSMLFLAIALLAAFFPSRAATRVDPIVALRYE
ncbi:ADOP family duplicated permease [Occallatibacter savannae]|uniref:ADOP family duplicated permease n=1 Tax=Occallatibacter savannae TaxID=1002691 RepID=UPI000D69230C|nr:ADOP family duplicated permease [Occallatibacter savannae]